MITVRIDGIDEDLLREAAYRTGTSAKQIVRQALQREWPELAGPRGSVLDRAFRALGWKRSEPLSLRIRELADRKLRGLPGAAKGDGVLTTSDILALLDGAGGSP